MQNNNNTSYSQLLIINVMSQCACCFKLHSDNIIKKKNTKLSVECYPNSQILR